MESLRMLLAQAIQIYIILIIVRAVLSWVQINPTGYFFKIYIFIIQITEPVMRPVREFLHKIFPASPLDFSPIIVIIVLNMIKNVLIGM
ncbi:MAG: YggT family protein [Candidatus Cloacimonetes bacterium]|jgi:YggT family protein|nr:YggT family protein [Candidatus Cloacimonadota bacterium]